MELRIASEAGSDRRANEDFFAAGPGAVVLLDGAGSPEEMGTGCEHGVAWYVQRLGVRLLAGVTDRSDRALTDCLADAIAGTAALHAGSCDLAHPGTPSATVVVVRVTPEVVEYLVLADSTLVLEHAGERGAVAVTDDREAVVGADHRGALDTAAVGTPEHAAALRAYVEAMRGRRNRPDGFWVAAADPAAAYAALTGSVPRGDLTGFTVVTDGASRMVDCFHVADWPAVLTLVHGHGPAALIRETRALERTDAEGRRWPRAKTHDDATVATVLL